MVGYSGEVVKIRLGFVKCQLNVMNDLSVSGLSIFADLLDLCWTVTEYFSNGHDPQVTMPLMASFWEKKKTARLSILKTQDMRAISRIPFLMKSAWIGLLTTPKPQESVPLLNLQNQETTDPLGPESNVEFD